MKKSIIKYTAAGMVLLYVSGCRMMNPPQEAPVEEPPPSTVNIFNFEGVPSEDYYVGGGFIIRYRASQNGILYVVEDESKRLMGSISMSEGEKYEVVYDINDADLVTNLSAIGFDPENVVIKIYFVPKTDF